MLEGGGQVLRPHLLPLLLQMVNGVDKGRFQAGKAEVIGPRRMCAGQLQGQGIALRIA